MLLFPNKGIQCTCNAEATASPVTLLWLLRQLQAWFLNCVAHLQLKVDSGQWRLDFSSLPVPDVLRIGKETICRTFTGQKAVSRSVSVFLGFFSVLGWFFFSIWHLSHLLMMHTGFYGS